MAYYRFFDRIVASDWLLPELPSAVPPQRRPAVVVSGEQFSVSDRDWRPRHRWRQADGAVNLTLAGAGNDYLLSFPDQTSFCISSADRRVSVSIPPGVSAETIRHHLVDQTLPRLCAHFFGHTVIHGALIETGRGGICLLADTGHGKSTLAGAFLGHGYDVLTDDCLRLITDTGAIYGQASYPSLRLLPDAMAALALPEGNQSASADSSHKLRISLGNCDGVAVPIAGFFVLEPAADNTGELSVQPLERTAVFTQLLRNSFALDPGDTAFAATQFSQLSLVARQQVPFFRLRYPRRFRLLPDVVAAVVRAIRDGDQCR